MQISMGRDWGWGKKKNGKNDIKHGIERINLYFNNLTKTVHRMIEAK